MNYKISLEIELATARVFIPFIYFVFVKPKSNID